MIKRTKIVATLSVQRCTEELVRSLFKAGMNIVRINSAHASLENAAEIIRMVRSVSNSIPVMLDTKGPEIRVTRMDDAYPDGIRFAAGDRVKVRGTSVKTDIPSTREVIYMNVEHIVRDVPAGATMLIADGEMELHVEQKSAEELVCRVMRDCTLRSRKSVNVPNVSIDLPSVTEKDRMYIEWATENGVDFIAHSFVRSARDVEAVQAILDSRNSGIKIISKIENQEGIDNIDEIIEASYGIMVARGAKGNPWLFKRILHYLETGELLPPMDSADAQGLPAVPADRGADDRRIRRLRHRAFRCTAPPLGDRVAGQAGPAGVDIPTGM